MLELDGRGSLTGRVAGFDGIGAHGVLVTVYQAYNGSISYIADRIGGKIMCIALPPAGKITLGTDPNIFPSQNLSIIGTLVAIIQDTAAALEYARRGQLKSIPKVRGLRAMPESAQQLRRGEVAGRVVIDYNKE
nr:hypothetical protein B0A51_12420 [Rachicladosporium sp. CCFEE 5018]